MAMACLYIGVVDGVGRMGSATLVRSVSEGVDWRGAAVWWLATRSLRRMEM
jgi:hypothetical protein